jgi:ABC-type Fe3+-citrate transport system substrate-binding protein
LKRIVNIVYDFKTEKGEMRKKIKKFRDRINKIQEKLKKNRKIKFEITVNEKYRKKFYSKFANVKKFIRKLCRETII